MKEENKARLIVVGIVAMLAVTMVMARYREDKKPIEWEEGYDEVAVTVPSSSSEPGKRHDKNESNTAIAVSTINGKDSLELNVTPIYSKAIGGTRYTTDIWVSVEGNISTELDPEELVIETEMKEAPEPAIAQDHYLSQWEAENLDLWPPKELIPGSGGYEKTRLGSDIEDNNFSGGFEFFYTYYEREVPFDEPITIEVRAILRGLSEEVTARAELTFEKEVDEGEDDEEESLTEFALFGESGKAYDYPTNLTVDETRTVILEVTNNKHTMVNYTLAIGLGYSYENMISKGEIPEDLNLTLPSNNTYKETDLTLEQGEKWNRTVNFSIGKAGKEYKLNFFLLRDGKVYRQLHLWIDIWEE